MATAEVGSLRVSLAMSAAEFVKGAATATATVERMSKSFRAAAGEILSGWTGITLGVTAVVAGLGVLFNHLVESGDELNKLAQKTGIAVEELSALKFAADLANVELPTLSKGLKTLATDMQEIASGDKSGGAARALTAMGISVTDSSGKLKGLDQVLGEIADKFATYEDGAAKSALATEIFKKSGTELIPLLDGGKQGLADARKEAEQFGLVISGKSAEAAEHLKDNLTRLGAVLTGTATKIVSAVAPALNSITDNMIEYAKEVKIAETVSQALDASWKLLVSSGIVLKGIFVAIGQQASNLGGLVANIFSGNFKGGLKDYNDAQDKLVTESKAKIKEITDLWSGKDGVAGGIQKAGDTIKKVQPPAVASAQSIADAQKEWNKSVQDGVNLVQKLMPPYALLGKQLDNLNDAYAAGKISAAQLADAQKELSETARIAFAGGADLIKATTTPYEQLTETLKKLQDQYDRSGISADALGKAQQQATLVAVNSYASMASNIAGNLGQLFTKSKAVSIAVALINTFESVTKALAAYPPPFSYIAAAAALAAGLAQVSKIKSTNKDGGGSSGGGSVGGSAATAAGPTSAPQTLMVEGIKSDHWYSGNSVAGIAKALVDYQRNGGQVVVQQS